MKFLLSPHFHLSIVSLFFVSLMACSETPETQIIPDQSSLRQLAAGPVVGFKGEHNNHAWLGIPFATPPVNNLRWKAPVANAPWTETLEAIQHGEACAQVAGSVGGISGEKGTIGGNEDCLYLSVYAPAWQIEEASEKALPVMVWLHGGSNTHGAGSLYDGSRLAAEQNVIVVSINYRLGPLGWFLHPVLNHEGSRADQSGNYGTLDILMALNWVRRNVGSFGGDVDNVTLFGESAGAFDLLSLMLSPLSEGLFHKAISQSGGINLVPVEYAMNYSDDDQPGDKYSGKQIDLYLHVQDGSAETIQEARDLVDQQSPEHRAQYLRGKNTNELFNAYRYGQSEGIARGPRVFADGYILPKGDPYALFSDPDKHLNIPLLIGTNHDELKLYLYGNPEFVDNYFSFYSVIKDEPYYAATAEYLSRMWKFNGVDRVASALYKSGKQNRDSGAVAPGVWAYRFDWDEQARPLGIALDKLIGAGHGMEIPFVFGFTSKEAFWSRLYDENNQASRELLSKAMRGYWGEFAHHGNPNRGQNGQEKPWLPWNGESTEAMKYIILDSPNDGGIRMSKDIVTIKSMTSDIAKDQRLDGAEQKCAIFAALAKGNSQFWPSNEYAAQLDGACLAFPLSEHIAD